ncbi:zf-HC2 domain-containing protein [Streptomyces sp. S465]|uniref:zf-HC2 domain-containing protein n=1 Tax=Streptomyces sp. S465 TaxID=2979468 RepID=UPI0022A845FE|nr:zf-HC2 domain-containing protein [Streptomyces sp. S465]WAP56885.1 zf-HC2 domain-containing protein [Streptomyces sp. S465]
MSRWTWWRTTRTAPITRTAQATTERRRTTRCPVGAPMLQSYLDGELDAPAAARVRAHVAECHRCARELAVYQRIGEALAARGATDEAVLDRLRDFAESLAERESREPGADPMPGAEPVPAAEPMPRTEPVPRTEAVPRTEPVPRTEAVPAADPVPRTEPVPGTETVPGTAPGAERDADQGAVHKAGG